MNLIQRKWHKINELQKIYVNTDTHQKHVLISFVECHQMGTRTTTLQSANQDFGVSNMMSYGGWRPESPVDEAVEYFEIDFETAYPPEACSTRYFYGTNEELPYGDDQLYVKDQRGYSTLVRNMLDNDVPSKLALCKI